MPLGTFPLHLAHLLISDTFGVAPISDTFWGAIPNTFPESPPIWARRPLPSPAPSPSGHCRSCGRMFGRHAESATPRGGFTPFGGFTTWSHAAGVAFAGVQVATRCVASLTAAVTRPLACCVHAIHRTVGPPPHAIWLDLWSRSFPCSQVPPPPPPPWWTGIPWQVLEVLQDISPFDSW